ncbi:nucleotide exchange factor GrpE [Saccharopolyspora sp. NFXS83]|uniref:nucleotide exchange factor GrpE n=1 Tax=Saccharopolyspora sp. NFXS83 TaxID=2993560 RepID=UPI003A4D8B6A
MRDWLRRRSSPDRGTERESPPSDPSADEPAEPDAELGADMTAVHIDPLDQARSERATLIKLCLYALDRARSNGVVERLAEGLGGIGVALLRPDGQPFDPARHEAGGTVPTDDPAMDGIIAETEVLGFADRDQVLRAPIVTVYQLRSGTSGTS